jgi:hypothetical protein
VEIRSRGASCRDAEYRDKNEDTKLRHVGAAEAYTCFKLLIVTFEAGA